MQFPIFLAHGALGSWDETIFISIIFIFIALMGISWFRSRDVEDETTLPSDTPPQAPPQTEDRFKLE